MSDPGARPCIPVLTYHSIDDTGSPVSMTAREFRRQMQSLAAAGWRTVTVSEFLAGHAEGRWPARAFLLTFDDGYRNVLEHALPVAAGCSFQGTVFVSTERVGGVMAGPGQPSWTPAGPLLDWTGLKTLASEGWSIASHGCTHRALPGVSNADATVELARSKETIEEELGVAVTAFAYPYGAVSQSVERLAAEHYEAAFGTRLARVTPASRATNFERIDAYYLKRLPVDRLDSTLARMYLAVRRAGRAMRANSL
jgi:peptidoglycan/xylan/chitin deacetylase (PgdA/CDA1 family)